MGSDRTTTSIFFETLTARIELANGSVLSSQRGRGFKFSGFGCGFGISPKLNIAVNNNIIWARKMQVIYATYSQSSGGTHPAGNRPERSHTRHSCPRSLASAIAQSFVTVFGVEFRPMARS
ncbi:MAG: hypothetical protein HC856_09680 [Pseudanabaena sp. RU_4_16]|nr:hypothetical protein [Pseudanabaena sp. RU_4_16]